MKVVELQGTWKGTLWLDAKKLIKKSQDSVVKKDNLQRFDKELSIIDFTEILDIINDTSYAFDLIKGIVQPMYDKTYPMQCLKPHG